MKKQLNIPLYTKIGPHWAEHLQKIFREDGSKLNRDRPCIGFSFEDDEIHYSLSNPSRCIVGEPLHLTSKWTECNICNRFGMGRVLDTMPWRDLEYELEKFAEHYLKEHLGCKL